MAEVIIPGTTPVFTYAIPADVLAIATEFEVAFSVKDGDTERVLLLKYTEDCEVTETGIRLQLYEEDTLKFPEKKTIRTQVRTRGEGFPRGVSYVMTFRSGELIREGAFDERTEY